MTNSMATRSTVNSGGPSPARLAVAEWGPRDRPTVLLVHGYPDTSAVWHPVATLLAARFHVVAYDVRGAGASSAPAATSEYALPHLVEDLAAVAAATSPDRPVHLVGHDWGSIQGWEAVTSERLNGRVASFTSLYAPSLDHAAAWARERLRHPTGRGVAELLGQQARSWYVAAFHLPGVPALWHHGLGRRWPAFLHRVEQVPTDDDYPAPTLAADAARGIALYRANFGNRLAHPRPQSTIVPVQVVVPTRDHYVSAALSTGLERWVPRLWRSPVDAGHWLPRTHPELVAEYVTELVDHLAGAPESPRLRHDRVAPPR
ncbi:MAG TPA: alpha/beta fold hydrolase [Acidimicrobiales bacterium]|nr:alpha/beta fold hydrolase [Acidimicrobiales bacterium]